jgi:hypothetical protein
MERLSSSAGAPGVGLWRRTGQQRSAPRTSQVASIWCTLLSACCTGSAKEGKLE